MPETSYDRFGDLRKEATRRRRRQLAVIVLSLAGMTALALILARVLSD
jgi:hypothetical protein